MKKRIAHRNVRPFGVRPGGFTLIEILMAMSLAVLVMVGVARVFKISADAVTTAESISSAYQQAQGVFSTMDRDFGRFSPEGYLAIVTDDVVAKAQFGGSVQKPTYNTDTLAFTVTGLVEDQEGNLGGGVGTGAVGSGGEVVYTIAGRKAGAGTPLPFQAVSGTDDDPRTMLLVRKVFPVSGIPNPAGTYVRATDLSSKARSCFGLMCSDRWNDSYSYFRMSAPVEIDNASNNASGQPLVDPDPVLSGGFPTYDSSVNLVVCDRVSEFYVEVLAHNTTSGDYWTRPSPTATGTPPQRSRAIWAGNSKNLNMTDAPYMPKLIRVTVVVNPYNDQKLLKQESYAGEIPTAYPKKYRGMVFREVFRLNGVCDAVR